MNWTKWIMAFVYGLFITVLYGALGWMFGQPVSLWWVFWAGFFGYISGYNGRADERVKVTS